MASVEMTPVISVFLPSAVRYSCSFQILAPLAYYVTKNKARTAKGEILSPGGLLAVRLSAGFRSQRPSLAVSGSTAELTY
jgi:hypothetical protein